MPGCKPPHASQKKKAKVYSLQVCWQQTLAHSIYSLPSSSVKDITPMLCLLFCQGGMDLLRHARLRGVALDVDHLILVEIDDGRSLGVEGGQA